MLERKKKIPHQQSGVIRPCKAPVKGVVLIYYRSHDDIQSYFHAAITTSLSLNMKRYSYSYKVVSIHDEILTHSYKVVSKQRYTHTLL